MTWRRYAARTATARWELPFAGVRASWVAVPFNTDLLVVRGRERYEVPETLYSTGYWGELRPTLRQALGYLLAPASRLVWRPRVLGGLTAGEFEAQGVRDQDISAKAAVLAAGGFLGVPGEVRGLGVLVSDVNPDGPAAGALRPGDVVTHVDGVPVGTLKAFLDVVEGGGDVVLTVSTAQAGAPRPLVEDVALSRDVDGRLGFVAATHRQEVVLGVDVDFTFPPDTGGPSLGLVLALSVLDVLTPGSLTGGRRVAVTGAIDPSGAVLPVGGVEFKALTAAGGSFDLFLVPAENLGAARAAVADRVEVVGVSTLAEAVDVLVARGGERPALR